MPLLSEQLCHLQERSQRLGGDAFAHLTQVGVTRHGVTCSNSRRWVSHHSNLSNVRSIRVFESMRVHLARPARRAQKREKKNGARRRSGVILSASTEDAAAARDRRDGRSRRSRRVAVCRATRSPRPRSGDDASCEKERRNEGGGHHGTLPKARSRDALAATAERRRRVV